VTGDRIGTPAVAPGGASPGEADCVARARAIAPLIAAAADRIEAARELPVDVLAALHDARMFRMLLPRSRGGEEVEPAAFVAAIEVLAGADASVAWCVAQGSGCATIAAYLKPEVAQAIFDDPRAVLAWGPSNATARVVAVEGGWRVTGTWNFASGSRHAGWLGGHGTIYEADGTPRRGADNAPQERTVLFRKECATVSDVWQVVGLKGTGSDSYAVTDLFVPADYAFTREAAADRREHGPLYRFTTYQIYAFAFAGVSLGIARATLDAFIALARDKVSLSATKTLRDNNVIQSQVALCEARLQSARGYLFQILRDNWQAMVANGSLSLQQRLSMRLASTWASLQAREVVDAAYHAAGATAIFASNPFERRFRDIHTVSQQVQANVSNFEVVGQWLLGLEPNSRVV
jgi:indole-3-acetate monooxygenase